MQLDQTSHKRTENPTAGLRVDFTEPDTATAAAPAAAGPSAAERLPIGTAVLVVKRGPNAGSRFLLDQPITSAGRHPGSDIYLDDITVSRRHAEFRRDSGETRIVDTSSLNGTYVNRQPVDSAILTNGDEIQIGNFRLVFLTNTPTS